VAIFDATRSTIITLTRYYVNWDAPMPIIDRTLRGAFPNITSWWARVKKNSTNAGVVRGWASTCLHWVLDLAKVDPEDLVYFATGDKPWTLRWLTVTLTKCDFGSILSCSAHTRDLFMSCLVFLIFYVIVLVLSQAMGLPMLANLFLMSFPMFITYYTYGVSVTCFPMVPTCLLSDVLSFVERNVPAIARFPDEVLCNRSINATNLTNATFLPDSTCLRACDDLNFTTWFDPIAFLICDLDVITCEYYANAWYQPVLLNGTSNGTEFKLGNDTISPGIWHDLITPLQDILREKSRRIREGRAAGGRICMWVTWIYSVPALGVLLSGFTVLTTLLYLPVMLAPPTLGLIAQVVAFHRIHTRE
jgi:hypothetical protein